MLFSLLVSGLSLKGLCFLSEKDGQMVKFRVSFARSNYA